MVGIGAEDWGRERDGVMGIGLEDWGMVGWGALRYLISVEGKVGGGWWEEGWEREEEGWEREEGFWAGRGVGGWVWVVWFGEG